MGLQTKCMAWLSAMNSDGTKILHLRESFIDQWQPYTAFPQYTVPDHQMSLEHGKPSAGWATMQRLKSQGWELVSTAEVEVRQVPVDLQRDDAWAWM